MHVGGDTKDVNAAPQFPIPEGGPTPPSYLSPDDAERGIFHHHNSSSQHLGPQSPGAVPAQGRRFQTTTTNPFPSEDIVGKPPFHDVGGDPIYIGSAIFPTSVHPCKLGPALIPPSRVPYNGEEFEHHGRYDVLPVTTDMEWVPTKHGLVPSGRRPVDGGYEETGERLYHAVAVIEGVSVPGKTAVSLHAAHIPFGGTEHVINEGYWILCWRE